MAYLWVRAELRRRWRALLLLTVLVGLTGATVLTAVAGARRTATAYGRLGDSQRVTQLDAQVNTDLAGEMDTDLGGGHTIRQIITAVRHLPAVSDVSLVGFFTLAPQGQEATFDFAAIAPLDRRTGRAVDKIIVRSGRLPAADAVDEVAFSPSEAKDLGLHVGDRVRMSGRSADQVQRLVFDGDTSVLEQTPDGPPLVMRVVGVVSNPDDIGRTDLGPYAYLSPAFFERYRLRIGVFAPTIGIRLRHGYRDVASVTDVIRKLAGENSEVVFDDSRTEVAAIEDGLRVQTTALLAFALVAAAAACVMVGQAFGRQLTTAGEDAEVLRTLGLTRRERAMALARVAAPVVLAGVGIALVASTAVSGLLPIGFARQVELHPGVRFDPLVHLGGAVVLLVVLGALAFLAAWRASRVRDPDANVARPPAGAKLAARLRSVPAGTGFRMAFDPRRGVPVRSAMTGATVAVAALVAALTFGASLGHLLDRPALSGFPWHAEIEGSEEEASVQHQLTRVVADPDTEAVGVVRFIADLRIDSRHVRAAGLRSAKGAAGFTLLSGRAPEGPDEVALGPQTMTRAGVGIGDSVTAKGEAGDNDQPAGTRRVRVVGTVLFPVIDSADYADGALFTVPGLKRVQTSGFVALLIRYRPGVDLAAKRKEFGAEPGYSDVRRVPAAVSNLDGATGFPQALAVFVAALGLGALLHVLVVTTRRWRGDLAVLRGLGMLGRQASASVVAQALTLGVVALAIGVPLGVAAGRWSWTLVARGLHVVSVPTVPGLVAVLVPVTLAVLAVASLVPAARVARTAPAAALRTE